MQSYRSTIHGWLLLLPASVFLLAFTYYPGIATIIESFYSTHNAAAPSRFVGAENYRTMFEDPVFHMALRNTLVYAVITVPVSMALALMMALFVNARIGANKWVRVAYFTPTVLPMIAVANIWLFFFAPEYGLLDKFTSLFGASGYNWLGETNTALGCLIAVTIWKEAGFFMIFYLAALQQISPTVLEAASLEGASRWQTLWRVTLPLLAPTTLFISINALINAVRLVDHVFSMTRGGPDSTTMLLLYYIYQVGFSYWDTSYAAALSVVLLMFLGAIALFQFGYLDKRTHYR